MSTTATKPRIATVWLDGCSGCHMSLLDMDERIIALCEKIDIVHSPIVDPKQFPECEVCIVEGAVSSEHDLEKARLLRERSQLVVSLGDCAVTGNVPAMRNRCDIDELLHRAYVENATGDSKPPSTYVPPLLTKARPLHEMIKVDVFLPGCPPPADAIHYACAELAEGRMPDVSEMTRFGK